MDEAIRLQRMRAYVAGIRQRDGREYRAASTFAARAGLDPAGADLESGRMDETAELEAVMRVARPVLAIEKDAVDVTSAINSADPAAEETLQIVRQKAPSFAFVIPAIGRIELVNNDQYRYAGTGWIVGGELGDDIIVTNAHVASLFAMRSRTGFVFSPGTMDLSRRQGANIDFREEIGGTAAREFTITDIIYISDRSPPYDVAFLRVSRRNADDRIAGPVRLAESDPSSALDVAAIGYPGIDSGAHDAALLMRIFGNVYEKKRLSPGKVVGIEARGISHDCSTLPGSSGSALIDMATGQAVGLHFRGRVFESNHAVPASALARLIKDRPWQGTGRGPSRSESPARQGTSAMTKTAGDSSGAATATIDANGVRLVLPIEITVRFAAAAQPAGGAPAQKQPDEPADAEAAAARVNDILLANPNVVKVEATYLFKDGMISDEIGIVIGVRPDAPRDPAAYGLESMFDGVPLVVEMANLESLVREDLGLGSEAPAQFQNYERDLNDPRFSLAPVVDDMTVTLHVSPEAGWRELAKFLARRDYDQITVGMYHFTAPHVIEAMEHAVEPPDRNLVMTIDRKKGDDIGEGTKAHDEAEETVLDKLGAIAGDRFKWVAASISGEGKLFHSAYHIKVAVLSERAGSGRNRRLKDKAFWLSSGNWQSSNQAPITKPIESLTWNDLKDYNREWHAIVENEKLATTFRNHLEQDFEDNTEAGGQESMVPTLPDLLVPEALLEEDLEAPRAFKAFAPRVISGRIKVTPVLTPDNYADVVVPLIKSARESVFFENQSLSLTGRDNMPDHYVQLADALLDRQEKGLDVRIIFRSMFGSEREVIRNAVKYGFDKNRLKYYDKCHTKGIVVDRKRVLLGSQNWTGAGTGPNRDASLLIDHPDAGAYFADLFEYSWSQIAKQRVRDDTESAPPIMVVSADEEAPVPRGYRRVSWREWMEP